MYLRKILSVSLHRTVVSEPGSSSIQMANPNESAFFSHRTFGGALLKGRAYLIHEVLVLEQLH